MNETYFKYTAYSFLLFFFSLQQQLVRNSSSYQPLNAEDCYKLQSVVSILAPYGIVNKYLYEVQIGVLFEPLTVLMTD